MHILTFLFLLHHDIINNSHASFHLLPTRLLKSISPIELDGRECRTRPSASRAMLLLSVGQDSEDRSNAKGAFFNLRMAIRRRNSSFWNPRRLTLKMASAISALARVRCLRLVPLLVGNTCVHAYIYTLCHVTSLSVSFTLP